MPSSLLFNLSGHRLSEGFPAVQLQPCTCVLSCLSPTLPPTHPSQPLGTTLLCSIAMRSAFEFVSRRLPDLLWDEVIISALDYHYGLMSPKCHKWSYGFGSRLQTERPAACLITVCEIWKLVLALDKTHPISHHAWSETMSTCIFYAIVNFLIYLHPSLGIFLLWGIPLFSPPTLRYSIQIYF